MTSGPAWTIYSRVQPAIVCHIICSVPMPAVIGFTDNSFRTEKIQCDTGVHSF